MDTLVGFYFLPFIVPFWAVPLAVTLVMPRFLFAAYLGWVALAVVVLATWLVEAGPRESGLAMIIAYAFFMAAAAGTGLGAVIKLVYFAVRRRAGQRPRYQILLRRIAAWALAAVLALWIAWRIYLEAGWAWHGLRPAWLVHGVLLASVLAAAFAAWLAFRVLRRRWRSPWKTGLQVLVWSFCGAWLAFLAAGALLPILVLDRAQAIAGGRPYCIQTSGGGDYLPVQSALELSPLNMQASFRDGRYGNSHGILVVGAGARPQLYHWSYYSLDFIADPYEEHYVKYLPALYCGPRTDFAGHLPWVVAKAEERFRVRIGGKLFDIPPAYQPHFSGGGRYPYFTFATEAPDFASLDRPLGVGVRRGWLNDMAWVQLAPNEDSLTVQSKIGSNERAGRESAAYGLARREVWWGADAMPRREYIRRDSTGRVVMLARCDPDEAAAGARCEEQFFHDGMLIRFSHAAADMGRWQELQTALVAKLESWEVAAPAP